MNAGGRMLTLPMVPTERPRTGANRSSLAHRGLSLDTRLERPADAPVATFSQAAQTNRVDAATIDALIEQLPVGVLVMDRDGDVSYANSAARSLEADRLPLLQRAVARALLTDQVVSEEVACEPAGPRPRRGMQRRLAVRAVPVRIARDRAHAVVVTVDDVTAQTQARSWEPVIASLMSL